MNCHTLSEKTDFGHLHFQKQSREKMHLVASVCPSVTIVGHTKKHDLVVLQVICNICLSFSLHFPQMGQVRWEIFSWSANTGKYRHQEMAGTKMSFHKDPIHISPST